VRVRNPAGLHFHDDPAGLFADVKLEGRQFTRYRVSLPQEQAVLLHTVRTSRSCRRRQALAGAGSAKILPLQWQPGSARPRNHAATATIRPPRLPPRRAESHQTPPDLFAER